MTVAPVPGNGLPLFQARRTALVVIKLQLNCLDKGRRGFSERCSKISALMSALGQKCILHARCRVGLDVLCFGRPLEQAAHGVDEMPTLCLGAPVPPLGNVSPSDLAGLLTACLLQHRPQNILALPS